MDKKEAGERLLEAIKNVKVNESKVIGQYRNLDLEVSYNIFTNERAFSLNGASKTIGEFGVSADGNITRLDNAIDKLPEKLSYLEEKLVSTKEQLQNALEELEKPFEKAEELKTKVLRLAELNKLLDMGEVEEQENTNPLLEDVKKAIIDFVNREYGEEHEYKEFASLYPDLKHVGIAYTETPDERHAIQFELNLEDYTSSLLVDGKEISHNDYLQEMGSEEKALQVLRLEMENADFENFVSVPEEELKRVMGLEIDDEGNYYDPSLKDLDNDGVLDKYDYDITDSDYQESTYDVEDNLQAKEEKSSILEQIKSFQSEQREDSRDTQSKEHDGR